MATTIRAEDTENLEEIEMQFAVKAVEHMSVYWRILGTVRGSELRLTRLDSEILEHLKKDFPDFDAAASIDEDEMKSKSGKGKWRAFMMAYEDKVDEFNFGTLLRINARDEPGEKTTIFVPRIQFLAIEIARNRQGLNDWIYEKENTAKAAS